MLRVCPGRVPHRYNTQPISKTIIACIATRFLLRPQPARAVAKYCDEYVSLCECVCLSAKISSKPHGQSLPIFVHAAYGLGSVLIRQCHEIPREEAVLQSKWGQNANSFKYDTKSTITNHFSGPGEAIGHVSRCVSACFRTVTIERNDLWPRHLSCGFISTLSMTLSHVKFEGSKSWVKVHTVARTKCC